MKTKICPFCLASHSGHWLYCSNECVENGNKRATLESQIATKKAQTIEKEYANLSLRYRNYQLTAEIMAMEEMLGDNYARILDLVPSLWNKVKKMKL